jgi:hypothetical protein
MPTQLPLYTTNPLPLDEAPFFSTSYGLLYQTDCLMLLGALRENVLDWALQRIEPPDPNSVAAQGIAFQPCTRRTSVCLMAVRRGGIRLAIG